MLDSKTPLRNYKADANLLADRTILITGADTELGGAVACTLAAHQATVILLGRKRKQLEVVYDTIEKSSAPQPALMPFNLTKASAESYEQLAQTLNDEFSSLDGLAHCDIDIGKLSPLEHYELPIFSNVLQANVNAPYLLTRTCMFLLHKSESASVIFTSSDAGRMGKPFWGAYGIACFAIEGMMQTWAAELQDETNIRMNSLSTGPVRTTQRASAYPGEDPTTLPTPDDIASAYLFLMGPDSEDLTGQALHAQQLPE